LGQNRRPDADGGLPRDGPGRCNFFSATNLDDVTPTTLGFAWVDFQFPEAVRLGGVEASEATLACLAFAAAEESLGRVISGCIVLQVVVGLVKNKLLAK
jgi:hypothetical protein